jgi:arabinogalactan endo-1,4-beta-galactosidase
MIKTGSSDNLIDCLNVLKSQNLNYVLAVFEPNPDSNESDFVNIYTSFENNDLTKLVDVLKKAKIAPKEDKKKEKPKKVTEI